MEHGKFGSVAAEIRKLGYKLESMRFSNGKNHVIIIIDEEENQEKSKAEELEPGGTWNYPSRV